MVINQERSKMMMSGIQGPINITVDGPSLQNINDFKYLGFRV